MDTYIMALSCQSMADGRLVELLARSVPLRRSPRHQWGAAPRNEFTVLFDWGIRTGSDIIMAIAMGAQGALVGRPIMYGLGLGGGPGEGVEQVLRRRLGDTEVTHGLATDEI